MKGVRLFACAFAVASLVESYAHAQQRASEPVAPAVQALLRDGLAARRAGRDAEAVELFRRALAIDARPMVRAQLAFAEQAAGAWEDAERDLQRAMASADDPWIASHRAIIEEASRTIAANLGSLEVLATPSQAQLFINGTLAATLPLSSPIRLRAGRMRLELRSEGYFSQERTVEVQPTLLLRERFALEQRPIAPPPTRVIPQPERVVAPPARVVIAAPYGAIALTATGSLSVLVGVVVTSVGAVQTGTLRDRCAATDLASTAALECPNDPSLLSLRDGADAALVAGQIVTALGLGATLGGALWWGFSRSRPRVSIAVTPRGASIGGQF